MKHGQQLFNALKSHGVAFAIVNLMLTTNYLNAVEKATPFQVWLEGYRIHRTNQSAQSLTWVIEVNGYQALGRNANNETAYTYHNNLTGNRHVVFLDGWKGDRYAPVSNKIGYVYGVDYAGPVISSELAEVVVRGTEYRYQIAATGHPKRLWAEGLPRGLKVDRNGQIYGRPEATGRYAVTLYAENTYDTTSATLRIDVVDGKNGGGLLNSHTLVVDENLIVTRTPGDGPISSGLTWIVRRNGVQKLGRNALSETRYQYYRHWEGGEFTVHLESLGQRVSNIVAYKPSKSVFPLAITNASLHSGTMGKAISPYTITTNLSCDDFSATDLPSGLRLEGNQIVGTPLEAGSFPVKLSVAGDSGYATALLTLDIDDMGVSGFDAYLLTHLANAKISRTEGNQPGLVWVIHDLGGELKARLPAHNREVFTIPPGWGQVYVALEAWIDGQSRIVSNTILSSSFPDNGAHAPVFTMLPKVLLEKGKALEPIEIEAAGQDVNFWINGSKLPTGMSFDGRFLHGNPAVNGDFDVPVHASNAFGSATMDLQLSVAEIVSDNTSFAIYHERDGIITRSSGTAEQLRWVVYRNGHRDYEYADRGQTTFHFLRSHLPGDFVIFLEAIDGKDFVRVSNMLSFRTTTEQIGPVLASPRDYVVKRGVGVFIPLEFSGDPDWYSFADAPPGLSLSSSAALTGTPGTNGFYESVITATESGNESDTELTFLVAIPSETGYASEYLLRMTEGNVLVRSPGEDATLYWTVAYDGEVVFRKRAGSHLNYSYHRDFLPGDYEIYLEGYRSGNYVRVSNIAQFSVNHSAPLIDHVSSTTSGQDDSFLKPVLETGRDEGGLPYVAYTYSVNTGSDEFELKSYSSLNMVSWEPNTFYNRIVLSADEHHEIRQDFFRAESSQMFFRYSVISTDE